MRHRSCNACHLQSAPAMAMLPSDRAVVTVSVVSHRQWHLVRPLLQELSAFCRGTVAKIVLTLNIPEAITLDADSGMSVVVLRNDSPKGFGANHNAAFAH